MNRSVRRSLAAAGVFLSGITVTQAGAPAEATVTQAGAPAEATVTQAGAPAEVTVTRADVLAETPHKMRHQAPRDVAVGTRLAAQTDPAVQLIQTEYAARVTVPTASEKKSFAALFTKARQHSKAGRIPSDHQSQMKWVLRAARSNVGRYLAPARPARTVKVSSLGLCTGWWVTPNGHMVTAAHCVGATKTQLRKIFAAQALPKINNGDVKGFLKQIMGIAQPDDELVELATAMFARFNTETMRVSGLRRSIGVAGALSGGGMDKTARVTPVTLVARGRNYPGEDFALLKMAGAKNLPTVPLGNDVDVRVGDTLYINGFPGLVSVSAQIFDLRSRLYPALTEGAYNAKRTTVLGVPYLQAQAPSYRGNSGGPVFSQDGRVIGTLIAGSVDPVTGESAENHSFILPVSIVRKRLAAAGVSASQSQTSLLYNDALNDFFAKRFRAALPKFRKTQRLYPQHPYVASYIGDTKRAIAAGKDRTPKTKA